MKIRTFKKLEDGIYRVSIYTEDWSEGDILLMEKFSEPEIDLGGDFGDSPVLFTLDNDLKRVKTDSPFAAAFDARDYTAPVAKAYANLWATTISDRIAAAVATLRASVDGFTTEEVEEI